MQLRAMQVLVAGVLLSFAPLHLCSRYMGHIYNLGADGHLTLSATTSGDELVTTKNLDRRDLFHLDLINSSKSEAVYVIGHGGPQRRVMDISMRRSVLIVYPRHESSNQLFTLAYLPEISELGHARFFLMNRGKCLTHLGKKQGLDVFSPEACSIGEADLSQLFEWIPSDIEKDPAYGRLFGEESCRRDRICFSWGTLSRGAFRSNPRPYDRGPHAHVRSLFYPRWAPAPPARRW